MAEQVTAIPDTATPKPTTASKPSATIKPATSNEAVIASGYSAEALKDEIGLMLNYAVNSGKEIPNTLVLSETATSSEILDSYNAIRKVIAPVTVESIRYINSQMILKGKSKNWYRIPIFSKCVIIAAISLVTLILISISGDVNEANQAKGLLNSSGLILFKNLIFICAASLLGVMFYLLKSFADKIKNYTLLPANAIELNASIIIGVISGFVISELFTYSFDNVGNDNIEFHKMTLALLGGFSSDAIFSGLQGIVNKFKNLVGS
ncbi:MAG: hypothetical protein AAGA77_14735 [Bacteroidota bacterium]